MALALVGAKEAAVLLTIELPSLGTQIYIYIYIYLYTRSHPPHNLPLSFQGKMMASGCTGAEQQIFARCVSQQVWVTYTYWYVI